MGKTWEEPEEMDVHYYDEEESYEPDPDWAYEIWKERVERLQEGK